MIQRQIAKNTNRVKLTFIVPDDGLEGPIAVVGDFNAWDPMTSTMVKRGKEWRTSLEVDGGTRYAFRYLAHDDRWFNDDAADDYQLNPFGGSDSVVDLTDSDHLG